MSLSDSDSQTGGFLAPPADLCDPASAGVIVLPVPYEATCTYGKGAAFGPNAIIEASQQVEFFDAALGFEPMRAAGGIATLDALDVSDCDGEALCKRLRDAVQPWLEKDRFVVTLGGEHCSVIGAVAAYVEHVDDLTVLQFDAHSDLRPRYEDDPWNHACAMARVLDFHEEIVAIGIRSQSVEERRIAEERGLAVFYAHQIHAREFRREDWVGEIVEACRPNVYITLDCDVMDPSILPGTGTPEPGGLTWQQMNALLDRLCRERNVAGMDVCELAPIESMRHSEFTAAKLIYRVIGMRFGRPQ